MRLETANYEQLIAENKRLRDLLEESRTAVALSIVLAWSLHKITLSPIKATISYMTQFDKKIEKALEESC